MIRAGAATFVGCIFVLGAGAARADLPAAEACPGPIEAAAGPLAGGTETQQPADFGAVPEACPGNDLLLRLRGELVDASGAPDFFGRVIATGTIRGRRRINARSGISVAVDLLTYRYVNDAGLASNTFSFGPATLGYHLVLAERPRGAVAAYARALIPIDTARQLGSLETGGELGAAGRARLGPRWLLDGGVSLRMRVDETGGQAHGHFEPAALAEAWFAPKPTFALFGGVAVRFEAAPEATLVTLAPRVGLRGTLRHGFSLAFLAEAPVAGNDRTNVAASFFVGWTPAH
ncbi:MAG TPA: hypothetical protein VI456_15460 [Polyangia bacterium]